MKRPDTYIVLLNPKGLSYENALIAAKSSSDWQVYGLDQEGKLKALQEAVEKTIKKIYPSGGGSFPVTLEELPPLAIAEIPVIKALELVQALRQSREGK